MSEASDDGFANEAFRQWRKNEKLEFRVVLLKALGRKWYEADINYIEGYRNRERILFSNDGLIFATYDHYQTFYEITK